ncbi:potassium channel subfamily K member 16-like isoform X1 [Hemiscyllium ocellatum]|uniref:potassium channel subfamily K member 16-like isoform X1 n=1 Tax=Hemiscyllium ocellatum TaxID=170820 RepID=UPI0029667926|nr:potassium channel subfamily K member 16-like isoform X1 [Hemiscyllium ocellatum]
MADSNRCSRRCTLLFLGYFMYLLIGAVVFRALELKEENKLKTKIWKEKLEFLKNCSCLSHEVLETFMEAITEAIKHGVNPIGNDSKSSHSNWDMSSSFFFAATVVSTIGYGNLSPTTAGGQIFCVFYALFGIPLHVIILGAVGKSLSSHSEKIRNCLFKRGMKQKRVELLTFLFFLVIGAGIFLALPPLVFCFIEKWSYREGVYYAFITLSTIGFGDYIVGVNPHMKYRKFYRAVMAIWILFGMAWLALLFNLLTTFMEDTEKKITQIRNKKKAKAKMIFGYNANANSSSEDVSILSDSETGVQKEVQKSSEQEESLQVELKTAASDFSQTTSEPESLNLKNTDQEISQINIHKSNYSKI